MDRGGARTTGRTAVHLGGVHHPFGQQADGYDARPNSLDRDRVLSANDGDSVEGRVLAMAALDPRIGSRIHAVSIRAGENK